MKRNYKTTNDTDRVRIINSYLNGDTVNNIAKVLKLARTTVHSIIQTFNNTGNILARKRGGVKPTKLNDHQKSNIRIWIDEDCTLTLKKIKEKIFEEFDVCVSIPTLARVISGFNYSLKRISVIPQRRNEPDVINARHEYAQRFISLPSRYSEESVIFIDEVGFNVSMRAGKGRSLIGKPANKIVTNVRSRNISICCAINKHGIIAYKSQIMAYNTVSFCGFISDLIENLRIRNINSAVFVMDNVRFHKSDDVLRNVENAGYEIMFLPPYSPFLNPIENMFSKWKEFSKRANPRCESELMLSITNGKDLITATDCEGYFRNMHSYMLKCLNSEAILD